MEPNVEFRFSEIPSTFTTEGVEVVNFTVPLEEEFLVMYVAYNVPWLNEVSGYMKPFLRHYRMFCLSTHILSTVGQRRISDGKYKSRNGQYEISFDDFTRNGVKIWSTADHSDEKQSSSFLVKGHQVVLFTA